MYADQLNSLELDFSARVLEVGQELDCWDGNQKWRQARISEVKGNRVLVHFQGLDKKHDVWLQADSQCLLPLEVETSR